MQPLDLQQLFAMLERGELSPGLYYRRRTLLAVAALAKTSKSHTPLTRSRLKKFRAVLDEMEGNDEVEVTGEALCEVVMLAIGALP